MVNSSDQRYMDQPDLVHLVPSNGATTNHCQQPNVEEVHNIATVTMGARSGAA